jgi:hypothetical protein
VRSHSERKLTDLAADGHRVLAALNGPERHALGRNWIRFRVDQPVVVDVAAPESAVPFWIADQGFTETGLRLGHRDGVFRVYRKEYPAGWVGLGVNALDCSSPSHYAIVLRPRSRRGSAPPRAVQPNRLRLVEARPGVSPFLDVDLPFASWPEEWRSGWVLQTERERRHEARLIHQRAWKTRVPSGPVPDQIAIAFGADAAHSLTWTWRTAPSVARSRLRLAVADPRRDLPAVNTAIRIEEGTSSLVEVVDLVNDPVLRRHRVALTDLEPDTRYVYSLAQESGWSPWRSTRTGPAPAGDYAFLYLGDPQTGLPAWGELIQQALRRRPDIGFLLIAGDLVDRGNERTNWDHYFLRAAPVLDHLPMMPAVGNHEYLDGGPRLYGANFALPANGPDGLAPGLAYSFTYADSLFVVLDSTAALDDPEQEQAQTRWLEETLARSPAEWKFVMFHHPLYASHPTREQPRLRDAWAPIFDRHSVDLVFQGHDHAYLRTYPLRGGRAVSEGGTVYLVSVSGDKFYDQAPRDYIARGITRTATYQVVDVQPYARKLTYRAFDGEGRIVDEFHLQKSSGEFALKAKEVSQRR